METFIDEKKFTNDFMRFYPLICLGEIIILIVFKSKTKNRKIMYGIDRFFYALDMELKMLYIQLFYCNMNSFKGRRL